MVGKRTEQGTAAKLELFARCAGGFEQVLAAELKALGAAQVRPLQGGVAFFGGLEMAYRACLWCRCATRIQLVLARVDAADAESLYTAVAAMPWDSHLQPEATLAVHAFGTNKQLRNTKFTALKVKDAICDNMREACGTRPNIDTASPDISIDVSVHNSRATIYLNLAGDSLHKRGYREPGKQAQAPLKETLAAGMLLAAGWSTIARTGGAFIDPMCGSGTLAIEAALMVSNTAPGLLRTHWGFEKWCGHSESTWQRVRAEAKESIVPVEAPIIAGDIDAAALQLARENAQRAGVASSVQFYEGNAQDLGKYLSALGVQLSHAGLLATNPPYGHRLGKGEEEHLQATFEQLVTAIPAGWQVALIAPTGTLDVALGSSPHEIIPCHNGPLDVTVRLYTLQHTARTELNIVSLAGREKTVAVVHPQSEQFAARLRKVAKERMKWARGEGISCFRIYDADLPDYASSIDCYTAAPSGETYLRINEYQAPASVDSVLAATRFKDTVALAAAVLDVDPAQVFSKVRRRAKGGGQYREAQAEPKVLQVEEGGYTFEVDLNSYVDTGLFLDHRVTREMVGKLALGTRFLNLFAYTGTASVYAAGGGATSTTTVDLSRTYLDWAQCNMAANGFAGEAHQFVQADVLQWLEQAPNEGRANSFDLVFCDPPTFSNSKSMGGRNFDVQRDHVALLAAVKPLLAPGATVIFSCNLRNFKLSVPAIETLGFQVQDITPQTISHDFERNPKIHHAYKLSHS